MMRDDTGYHALLIEYASGCLDEARALAVATHMALSPAARKFVAEYESIGGSMLEGHCKPVAMKEGARDCVLGKLEAMDKQVPEQRCGHKKPASAQDLALPVCLEHYMETACWVRKSDGTQTLSLGTACTKSRAELVRLAVGGNAPPVHPNAGDVTLVLKGVFRDGQERYRRGDLIVIEEGPSRTFVAETEEECVFFIARPARRPLHDLLHQVMAYLSK